jgi:opacity protein-like surface antigen
MNKFIKILISTCVLGAGVFAQNTSQNQSPNQTDEYRKNEFFVGYSRQQIDDGNFRGANGAEFSYVRNVHKYFGIKADVSGAFRNDEFQNTGIDAGGNPFSYRLKYKRQVYNFLGGVQVKNNASDARFKPFAHALAGVAVTRTTGDLTCTQGNCTALSGAFGPFTDTNFALAVGGGLDIKINDKIDFRAIQVDYNPIWRGTSSVQNNVRFGIGFVIK